MRGTMLIKEGLLVVSLLSVTVPAHGSVKTTDPCKTPVRAAAAKATRQNPDFVNRDPQHKIKSEIRAIDVEKSADGRDYVVDVEFGLPPEDDGETGSITYLIHVSRSGNRCVVVGEPESDNS